MFTLIIPTFNRPDLFARLIAYADACRFRFPVIVLDSSQPQNVRINAAAIATTKIDIQHETFPVDTPPFSKFALGIARVRTPFCALCADDDVFFPDAIDSCIDFLNQHSTFALAHGWYFDFLEASGELQISRLQYTTSSLAHNRPLMRVLALISNYEAVTYAVHRTPVAKQAFEEASTLGSTMTQELLSSSLCLLAGKAARLPFIYYGRNSRRLTTYSDSHPLAVLAHDPGALFMDYVDYRTRLIERLSAISRKGKEGPPEPLLDLAHLQYLSAFISRDIINFILSRRLDGITGQALFDQLWDSSLLRNNGKVSRFITGSHRLRSLKNTYFPGFSLAAFLRRFRRKSEADQLVYGTLRDGTCRRYRIYHEFLIALEEANNGHLKNEIEHVTQLLNYYV